MKPVAPPLPERLSHNLANEDPAFWAALNTEALNRARRFIAGMTSYSRHPAQRDAPEAPVIWQQGTTQLRDYNPTQPQAPILLVIPSLINRFDILDLDFAPSFLRTLAAAGFRPLVIDWNEPGAEEKDFTLNDYVRRLLAVVDDLGHKQPIPIHLIGYCMGGVLALALATLRTASVNTLTLLATPWDFHAADPVMAQSLGALGKAWEPLLKQTGLMPVDLLQFLFAQLQPFHVVEKFMSFAAMRDESLEARQFVLVEDWLNNGPPLAHKVARECWQEWYGDNKLARLGWKMDGYVIDPRRLSMPSYVVVPGRDRIVPPESALPLAKLLPHATLHEPMIGHIGMMASRQASQQVWKPLLHWLDEHR